MNSMTVRFLPAFMQELAAADSDGLIAREWAAGLAVLRIADGWRRGEAGSAWGFSIAGSLVAELGNESRVHRPLRAILNALHKYSPGGDTGSVARVLWRYARALELSSSWAAAGEVYRMVMLVSDPDDEFRRGRCTNRIAFCLRWSNQLDESLAEYRRAERLARRCRDLEGVVWARCGRTAVLLMKGNIPLAARIAEDTMAIANRHNVSRVKGRAYHIASNVAALRGDHAIALQLGHSALLLSAHARERDRVLCDIGGILVQLRVFDEARRVYSLLAATSDQQTLRWVAVMHLVEIESYIGTEAELTRYVRMLLSSRVPPAQRAVAVVHVGEAYQRIGRADDAEPFLREGLALAVEHGVNAFVFRAEEALARRHHVPPRNPPTPDLEIRQIAELIGRLAISSSQS